MKSRHLILVTVAASALAGCKSDGYSKAEMDSIKNSPKMTDKDRTTVANAMAKGGEIARNQEAEWAKAHPDEVAKINADRAKMGRAPLGQ